MDLALKKQIEDIPNKSNRAIRWRQILRYFVLAAATLHWLV